MTYSSHCPGWQMARSIAWWPVGAALPEASGAGRTASGPTAWATGVGLDAPPIRGLRRLFDRPDYLAVEQLGDQLVGVRRVACCKNWSSSSRTRDIREDLAPLVADIANGSRLPPGSLPGSRRFQFFPDGVIRSLVQHRVRRDL